MLEIEEKKQEQQDIDKLWDSYFKDPSVENKNEILLHYMHLVKKVVLRMMPSYKNKTEYDDLVSSGIIGLMDAINKYDQLRGVKFETYAYKRIRGEILDFMRRQDFISSSMRTRIKKVAAYYEEMQLTEGRDPTEEQAASALGLTEKQVREALDNAYIYNVMYFESVIASNSKDESVKLIDTVREGNAAVIPEERLEQKEMLDALKDVLQGIPENEKLVLDLYYNKELLLKEIAHVMGISESRVSQIHSKAIKRLQQQMGMRLKED